MADASKPARRGVPLSASKPAPVRRGVAPSVADEWRANCFSRAVWHWVTPLLVLGYKRPLEMGDLGDVHDQDRAGELGDKLERLLQSPPSSAPAPAPGGAPPSDATRRRLYRALLLHETHDMGIAFVGKLLGDLLGFVGPLALSGIVNFCALKAEGKEDATWGLPGLELELGWWWLIALVVSSLLQNLCLHTHHSFAIRAGMHVRSSVAVLVYRRALRLSGAAKADFGAGFIQNLASTDANSFNMLFWMVHYTWSSPLQLAICMYMLYVQLGPSAFVALAVLIVLGPLQGRVAGLTSRFMKRTMVHSDARVKLISEIVTGIRILKFMAWERFFASRVLEARTSELREKRNVAVVGALNTTLLEIGPLLVALLSFLTYAYTSDEPLTAARAFSSLALFNILRLPLMIFPMLLSILASAQVSAGRFARFLDAPDMPEYRTLLECGARDGKGADDDDAGDAAVEFVGATLRWDVAPETAKADAAAKPKPAAPATSSDAVAINLGADPFALRDVTLRVPRGKLTTVVGAVGAGKSTLLAALLGELRLDAGKVILRTDAGGGEAASAVAYCSQQPWILNASVRDNILFGEPLDPVRYARILEACALAPDLAILPAGDETEIGERGVNLSGGQKARIALARAVYSACPLVLLDDVLSAVDAHVGRHLFDRALREQMAGRTIILVSHQLQFVARSDAVIVVEDGRVVQSGSYEALMTPGPNPRNPLREMMQEREKIDADLNKAAEEKGGDAAATAAAAEEAAAAAPSEAPAPAPSTATATAPAPAPAPAAPTPPAAGKPAAPKGAGGALMTEEDRFRGGVSISLPTLYLADFGLLVLTLLVLTLLLSNVGRVGTDWWLGYWSTETASASTAHSIGYFVGIYGAITVATSLLTLAHQLTWAVGGVRAALKLHSSMFDRILRSPTSFFDTTPVGRILNRFSGDIAIIDKDLPTSFSSFVNLTLRMLATIVVQAVIMPWTLVGALPIFVLYVATQQFYRRTSRELKRLDNISKSPIYAHLSESLTGLPTLRSYAQQARFVALLENKVDENVRPYWKMHLTNRWSGLRFDWIGTLLVGVTSLVAVLTAGTVSPGLIGLAISYALAITNLLNWLVRGATETETYFASVERVQFYASLPVERAAVIEGTRPPASWPSEGRVVFRDLTVRYRPDLDPVLRGVTADVAPGHKVGVVGRTGSGKSSLMLALFRILEAEAGAIEVDGVDIATLGLDDLRSRLAIIPQDPTLFSGPLRYNLDPQKAHADEALWRALERVQLGAAVRALGGLDAPLTEGGDNLSVGQRQLLCMARARLRQARVLVLDEATASVDVQTDAMIQTMVREAFKGTTVLIVAHRINTILDCDRVMVLDQGRVAEFGSPAELRAKGDASMFAQLVKLSATATAGAGVEGK
jgi:ABC-type multidrug transport system fused ATPase/permease subunit